MNVGAAWRWLGFLMNLSDGQLLLAGWLGLTSLVAFLLFGYDKWQAGRGGGRVAESTLWLVSALGGWPGGLGGILVFRHKSAKTTFQLKFAAAFVVWAGLVWAGWKFGQNWSRRGLAAGFRQTAAGSPRLHESNRAVGDDACG